MKPVKTRHGEMHVIPSDGVISRSLSLYGEWAKDELDFLKEFISPGAHVLDIGAYIGTHSLAFARFTGIEGQVYAFEPRAEIFQILRNNIYSNQCAHVLPFNVGVSDEVGQVLLEPLDLYASDNFGGHGLASQELGKSGVYQTTITTIDSTNFSKVDFIKIDVEGMELRVLQGALQTITSLKPTIFCECNSMESGAGVLNFANKVGYKVFGFLSDAFSKNNFNGVTENIFGNAKELGLLLVPPHRLRYADNLSDRYRLCSIETLDAITLCLLHKPQYPDEVLSFTTPSKSLGILYPSPLSRTKDQSILLLTTQLESQFDEIRRIRNSFSWQVTKPIRLIAYLGRRLKAMFGLDN